MLFPIAALLGSLFLLTREQEREVGPQPTFPPEAVQKLALMKALEGGGQARYFKPEISQQIQQALAGFALEAVQPEALPNGLRLPGLIYRIIPLGSNGAPLGSEQTALQAITTAQTSGFIVLATLSVVLLGAPGEKLLMLCAQSERRLASSGSHWAILADAVGVPAITEPAPAAAVGGIDVTLPMDLRIVVSQLLANSEVSPRDLEETATVLDGSEPGDEKGPKFPLTVAMLRQKAETIRMRDRIREVAKMPVEVQAEVMGNPDPPLTPDQVVEESHAPQVLGNVMGDKRPKKKDAPPNGAATA